MGIDIGECAEPDELHELFDLVPLFMQDATRDETGLNVPAHSEPWKEIRILENEAAFGVRFRNRYRADEEITRIGGIEAGDETKQR